MRVRTWIEQEVDIDVPLDAVIEEIQSRPAPESVREMESLLNSCIGAIKRIPTEMIAQMQEPNRDIVFNALRDEAVRYVLPKQS